MQTAYQVGKGMTKHVLELARQAAEEAEAEGAPPEVEDIPHVEPETTPPEPNPEPPVLAAIPEPKEPDPPIPPQPQPPQPPQRRMRFAFDPEVT